MCQKWPMRVVFKTQFCPSRFGWGPRVYISVQLPGDAVADAHTTPWAARNQGVQSSSQGREYVKPAPGQTVLLIYLDYYLITIKEVIKWKANREIWEESGSERREDEWYRIIWMRLWKHGGCGECDSIVHGNMICDLHECDMIWNYNNI